MTARITYITLVWLALLAGASAYPGAAADDRDFFETKVRPVLANSCLDCHTDMRSGGLRLDSREAMLKGGKSGPALVPGDPEKSLLIQAVRQTGALKMPKGGKLTAAEIDGLVEWVKNGAVWPTYAATDPSAASVGKPSSAATTSVASSDGKPAAGPAAATPAYVISSERRAFWAFQPLRAPQPPQVKDASWARTGLDRFVLARLEREGLTPVRPADRATLIRRATLDLIGVSPTPEEIEAFANDTSPDAFAKVVDRLLASPHYGETWGRSWLDVARYGEDDYRSLDPKQRGFNPYPNAYL